MSLAFIPFVTSSLIISFYVESPVLVLVSLSAFNVCAVYAF